VLTLAAGQILRAFAADLAARRKVASVGAAMAMDRMELNLLIMDTCAPADRRTRAWLPLQHMVEPVPYGRYIKYPLPTSGGSLIPYNYCALPRHAARVDPLTPFSVRASLCELSSRFFSSQGQAVAHAAPPSLLPFAVSDRQAAKANAAAWHIFRPRGDRGRVHFQTSSLFAAGVVCPVNRHVCVSRWRGLICPAVTRQ
jgi:hypothetical protein